MFVDLVKVKVKSGKGGDGMVAFRREKYVPMGGPSGGDGGRGGHIVFVGDEGLSTLLDLRFNKLLVAEDGQNGMNKRMDGKTGNDLVVRVPVGTSIFNEDTGKVVADITEHKQEVTILKGGRGGRGNVQFTTSRNTAPEIAEKGEPSKELNLIIELKLLADVAFVGMPSVGKSTLISIISKSRPKIADYHFTTLSPNLGVVGTKDGRSFVAADLPGLIEGASLGHGLGLQFLKHIERTRVILHILDMSAYEGRDPFEDYEVIQKELESYGHKLIDRPQIIVANKMDLPNALENLETFKSKYKGDNLIVPISAATKDNIELLLLKTADLLDATDSFSLYDVDEYADMIEYKFEDEGPRFEIVQGSDGVYEIKGESLRKIFEMTNFSTDQSIARFARQMRTLGVDEALRKHGVKNGDTVRLFGHEFEFID
ncbi:GTPase ObgE [Liberiplasma polymorphum]|uniref:GTPase ObgE n=1 Tax=Liberiplasma polymorphum TaxID=3374570 RepID=UPI003774F70B